MDASGSAIAARKILVGLDVKDDMHAFSGTTYHLGAEGVRAGFLTATEHLFPKGMKALPIYAAAAWWKLRGGLRNRRGFKYTNTYVDAIWRRHLARFSGAAVISNFQLFGPYFVRRHRSFDVVPYIYTDGSLWEYFNTYAPFDTAGIDKQAMRQALITEQESYDNARAVMVMSARSANCLAERYAVPRTKMHVIPPAANIPEPIIYRLEPRIEERRGERDTLVVGFVGLAAERKGLPVIAAAIQLARSRGLDVRLNVIGNCPPEIAARPEVSYFGRIDKRTNIEQFIEIVGALDLGCMLSRAELAGIALLEFLRLGVPVIASDVGGIPDIIALGAGELVRPDITAEELATIFTRLMEDRDHLRRLQRLAWERRHRASWKRVIEDLQYALV